LAASLFNRTDVTISSDHVRVCSYPIPWSSTLNLSSSDIVDVKAKPSIRSATFGFATYKVQYRNKENAERELVTGGTSRLASNQAKFIEYHIRRTLGLPDR
jgi:hypothetical protein